MADVAMNQVPIDVDVWTTQEVATYLRISVWEVRKLARAGQLPGRRVGDWRFHCPTIMGMMQESACSVPKNMEA